MTDQTSPTVVDPVRIRRELTELSARQAALQKQLKTTPYEHRNGPKKDLAEVEDKQRLLELQLKQHNAAEAAAIAAKANTMANGIATEISRADAKAGYAVGGQLVVAGAVASGIAGIDGPLQIAAVALLLLAVVLAFGVILSLLPRRIPGQHHDWMHFGAARGMEGDEVAKRLSDDAGVADALCLRVVTLSRIAYLKHLLVVGSMWTSLAGLLVAVTAALLGLWR